MAFIDLAILVVLVVAIVGGITKGFFRSAFSLGGLIAGLLLAFWNYTSLAHLIGRVLPVEPVASACAFMVIVLAVMALAGACGEVLAKTFHLLGLGCLDRIAGGFFGLFQGILLVNLVVLVTLAFFPFTRWLTEARLPRAFFGICHLTTHVSPERLADQLRINLFLVEKAAPHWMHPKSD